MARPVDLTEALSRLTPAERYAIIQAEGPTVQVLRARGEHRLADVYLHLLLAAAPEGLVAEATTQVMQEAASNSTRIVREAVSA